MKIYNLRNDHLLSRYVYSDILNRKFQKKKIPFRQENLDWAECVMLSLPHTKLSGVFEGRIANGRKAFSLFMNLDATTFVLVSVITLIEKICPKIWTKARSKNAKKPLSVAIDPCVNRKRHAIFKRSDKIHYCKQRPM